MASTQYSSKKKQNLFILHIEYLFLGNKVPWLSGRYHDADLISYYKCLYVPTAYLTNKRMYKCLYDV